MELLAIPIGLLMVLVGLIMENRAPGFVMRAVNLWPRPVSSQDVELMYSSVFFIRFVGLFTTVTGCVVLLIPLI